MAKSRHASARLRDQRIQSRENAVDWEREQAAGLVRREWIKAGSVALGALCVIVLIQANRAAGGGYGDPGIGELLLGTAIVLGAGVVSGFIGLTILSRFIGMDGGPLALAFVRMLALSAFFSMFMFFGGSIPIYTAIPAFAFTSVLCFWLFDMEMQEAAMLTGAGFVLTLLILIAISMAFAD